jgi:hypothetical protein
MHRLRTQRQEWNIGKESSKLQVVKAQRWCFGQRISNLLETLCEQSALLVQDRLVFLLHELATLFLNDFIDVFFVKFSQFRVQIHVHRSHLLNLMLLINTWVCKVQVHSHVDLHHSLEGHHYQAVT